MENESAQSMGGTAFLNQSAQKENLNYNPFKPPNEE